MKKLKLIDFFDFFSNFLTKSGNNLIGDLDCNIEMGSKSQLKDDSHPISNDI